MSGKNRPWIKVRLHEWYHTVAECTIREIKSARDAIKSNPPALSLAANFMTGKSLSVVSDFTSSTSIWH